MDDESDTSSLSSLPQSEDESSKPIQKTLTLKAGKLSGSAGASTKRGRKRNVAPLQATPTPSPERETSPPHDYVLADNSDIAVLVMFRSRFADVFPKSVPHLGPQDIESGVVGEEPSAVVEHFLCALLGLVLNRKKYVERGHHGRALEECLQTNKSQWPTTWDGVNPLSGNRTFSTMTPTERIGLLRTLTNWCLSTSEVVSNIIKESYKQTRHETDVNQPLSVQPWGTDGRRRRYWLVEGQLDTTFRLYRESAPKAAKWSWWSVAGTIDELRAVGEQLRAEGSQAGRRLADQINTVIPRFEASEEKRKKKAYKSARRAAFVRPEPGFSLYEGRTRGKRMKYTFSDEEDYVTDNSGFRRSTRQSSRDTPAEAAATAAPNMTSSGRTVKSRYGSYYYEPIEDGADSTAKDEVNESEALDAADRSPRADGRPRRSGRARRDNQDEYGSLDELDDDGDDKTPSGEEWSGNENDIEGKYDEDEDEEEAMSDDGSKDSLLEEPKSLIVNLKYKTAQPVLYQNHDHDVKDPTLDQAQHGCDQVMEDAPVDPPHDEPHHDVKDNAISRAAGATSDITIGDALKDTSAPSITATITNPSAAPEIDAGVTKPPTKPEPHEEPMPDAAPIAYSEPHPPTHSIAYSSAAYANGSAPAPAPDPPYQQQAQQQQQDHQTPHPQQDHPSHYLPQALSASING